MFPSDSPPHRRDYRTNDLVTIERACVLSAPRSRLFCWQERGERDESGSSRSATLRQAPGDLRGPRPAVTTRAVPTPRQSQRHRAFQAPRWSSALVGIVRGAEPEPGARDHRRNSGNCTTSERFASRGNCAAQCTHRRPREPRRNGTMEQRPLGRKRPSSFTSRDDVGRRAFRRRLPRGGRRARRFPVSYDPGSLSRDMPDMTMEDHAHGPGWLRHQRRSGRRREREGAGVRGPRRLPQLALRADRPPPPAGRGASTTRSWSPSGVASKSSSSTASAG